MRGQDLEFISSCKGDAMKLRSLRNMLVAIVCVGLGCPPSVLADGPIVGAKDVALRPGGVLVGQVVDQQGTARPGFVVSILQGGRAVVSTSTDTNGIFAAQGLRGGQYQLVTENGQSFCRLWAANTAPPVASDAVVLVTGEQVIRGQWGWGAEYGGRWLDWVRSHPYITAGIVAAAVAAPLAVAATDDDDGPNS
jgi:hypothetical protein